MGKITIVTQLIEAVGNGMIKAVVSFHIWKAYWERKNQVSMGYSGVT